MKVGNVKGLLSVVNLLLLLARALPPPPLPRADSLSPPPNPHNPPFDSLMVYSQRVPEHFEVLCLDVCVCVCMCRVQPVPIYMYVV